MSIGHSILTLKSLRKETTISTPTDSLRLSWPSLHHLVNTSYSNNQYHSWESTTSQCSAKGRGLNWDSHDPILVGGGGGGGGGG